mmetsp:Transcript_60862/g.196928  ORF Transcript_60862/g.196928 Transcript_60862/m.196928 type:complete len:197 (+) Transcript_60862:253-843(+)
MLLRNPTSSGLRTVGLPRRHLLYRSAMGAIASSCSRMASSQMAACWTGFEGSRGKYFAVTVSDLDEPFGVGAMRNRVQGIFWAANIPGDWRELSAEKVAGGGGVIIGRNRKGKQSLEPICPTRGRHRLRVTLWVLRAALPGLGPDTPYAEVMEQFEAAELAKATVFAEVLPDEKGAAASLLSLHRVAHLRRRAGAL